MTPGRPGLLLPAATLWLREMRRFFRQPNRIAGAVGTPLAFWLFIGSGLSASFRSQAAGAQAGYLAFFLPGAMAMTILFTSIFATISIIEDRREGFMQGMLVSPAPRASVVLGKLFGGATLALLQSAVFIGLSLFSSFAPSAVGAMLALAAAFLLAFALTGLGFLFAWRLESIQGFHSVMSLLLFPLWLLSGAIFPLEGAPAWLRAVMLANPVSYGVAALRGGMNFGTLDAPPASGPFALPSAFGLTALFAALMLALCAALARRGATHPA